jgi:hypothetical protein
MTLEGKMSIKLSSGILFRPFESAFTHWMLLLLVLATAMKATATASDLPQDFLVLSLEFDDGLLHVLNIAELEAYSWDEPTTNKLKGMPVFQSSSFPGTLLGLQIRPENCVDEVLQSICHTFNEVNPWINVTIPLSRTQLARIRITNRLDGFQDRLLGVWLRIRQAHTWVVLWEQQVTMALSFYEYFPNLTPSIAGFAPSASPTQKPRSTPSPSNAPSQPLSGRLVKQIIHYRQAMNVSAAKEFCRTRKLQGREGALAMIKSREDQLLVDALGLEEPDYSWIGAFRAPGLQQFYWNDLSPLTYENWEPSYTNIFSGYRIEKCIQVTKLWFSARCERKFFVLCEFLVPAEE